MRRPSPFNYQRNELEITMTPMIDVVFLLLIFFLWTASFQIVERILPSHLSDVVGSLETDTDEPPPIEEDFDRVVLRVLWDGNQPHWRINDKQLSSLQQVRRQLETIASINLNAPVIVHPDKEVPLGHVIDLYDISRIVGFQEIQFTASENI